ncbi:MAG TPA: hypothetical protein DEP78_05205 [Verrucomicrobiales bacterium]|nr:hypothetical protein [Verrucomicrobiales bacterium]
MIIALSSRFASNNLADEHGERTAHPAFNPFLDPGGTLCVRFFFKKGPSERHLQGFGDCQMSAS